MKNIFKFKEIEEGLELIDCIINDKNVVIPSSYNGKSVISIGENAFMFCRIDTLIIPEGVKYIKKCAFCCSGVKVISLPDSLLSIGEMAFSDNELKDISIPKGIKYLTSSCFSENKIEKVVIPNNVKIINKYAFWGNNIKELSIPKDSVINDYKFRI